MAYLLKAGGLTKTFRMHMLNDKIIRALENVSFQLQEGEILGITGQSGSGKSTLMKCIYRTCLPTSGEILFHSGNGGIVDMAVADEHTVISLRRREITYCSQFLQAMPRVPAVDVVAERLYRQGSGRAEATRRARECLAELRLPRELWDAYPSTFSGGEQQRVNIARSIISQPRLLLVDEPTASLDDGTKEVVINMLLRLREGGTSIMLITHDAHTLARTTDRRVELSQGRVYELVRS